jgi:UDP:flavonoid glycosyltransferase YjiC (YdhE family)
MNVILFTIGSHGDVHPFVGIGVALRKRGHDVTLITNEHFRKLAESAGLNFVALGTEENFQQLMHDPDLWHPSRGFDAVFLRGVLPSLKQAYELVAEHYVPGQTVMAASSLGLGARIAQDKLGIPTATVHISPAVLRSIHDNPRLPLLFMPRWLPKWLKQIIWDGGDKYVIDPKLAPAINQVRASLDLPPVKGILNEWWMSPQRVIGMWPEWFGPVQPDWPKQMKLVGFGLYDETGVTPMSDELLRWLDEGEAPIAFTAGSAMAQGSEFYDTSAQACVKLNRRGLLLTRHKDQLPKNLPTNVRHESYAPFGQLLPRCAALVHHGGIGTTAQALRAGVPQVIMPMSHDQFDNAARVRRLGVGGEVPRKKYMADRVARELAGIVDSPAVAQACRKVQKQFTGDALSMTCEVIEQLPDIESSLPAQPVGAVS